MKNILQATPTWIFSLTVCGILYGANLVLGNLNQDEGWYLYTAKLMSQGQLPFRDFAYTQGPIMPQVYAWAYPVVDALGVAGGRVITALFALIALLLSGLCAVRLAPAGWKHTTALLCITLLGINVYHSYYTTVVKTYGLCTAIIMLGFYFFIRCARSGNATAAFFAGVFIALASGVRISTGIALFPCGLYLLMRYRSLNHAPWLAFGMGGILCLTTIFLPFYLMAPEAWTFGMFEYHTARNAGDSYWVFKAGFISRMVQAYYLAFALLVVLFFIWFKNRKVSNDLPNQLLPVLWLCLLSVSLVHFTASIPYEDYQVVLYPLFCVLLSTSLCHYLARHEFATAWKPWLPITVTIIATASAFSSPVNQDWMTIGRDRIWWRMKDKPDLLKLQDVGMHLRKKSAGAGELFTQDAYLAVESGLDLPKNMAMGCFSYYPNLPRARAEKLHVMNREMLHEYLNQPTAKIAALSEYSLAIQSPEISELSQEQQEDLWSRVLDKYQLIDTIPDFGHGHTTLKILQLKPAQSD